MPSESGVQRDKTYGTLEIGEEPRWLAMIRQMPMDMNKIPQKNVQ
jgi:hypothetical protein